MDYHVIMESVISGDEQQAQEQARQLLAAGAPPLAIINQGLIAGMATVGRLFKEGEMYVPEVMMAAATVSGVMELLKPLLEGEIGGKGTVVIGTVKGDLHDIGKNLVVMLLENNGFTVIDLGADVAPQAFVTAAKTHAAQIVGLSALLTTTMPQMAETVAAFAADGSREGVKIIIGGAPVTLEYADEIQADGYAADAVEAVELCERLLRLVVE